MPYIKCEKCGGYYELKEGESLKDFDNCTCGGNLSYQEKISEKENNNSYNGVISILDVSLIIKGLFISVFLVIFLYYIFSVFGIYIGALIGGLVTGYFSKEELKVAAIQGIIVGVITGLFFALFLSIFILPGFLEYEIQNHYLNGDFYSYYFEMMRSFILVNSVTIGIVGTIGSIIGELFSKRTN